MKPLLQSIADYYLDRRPHDLHRYCFVLPNKRPGVFLDHYMSLHAAGHRQALLHPAITTITDFVTETSGLVEASRIEQLFTLYTCYRDIISRRWSKVDEKDLDFNRFQYWGEVILNDFTDVDKYLVDPGEIFHNIEALKEINSNYLEPEQIEIIRRYWSDTRLGGSVAEFWRHIVHTSPDNKKGKKETKRSTAQFVRMWQMLKELYDMLNQRLASQGLSYQGAIYRDAVHKIADGVELPYTHYVFIGFNVLSTAEEKIFTLLRDRSMADFWWDYASPAFTVKENRATSFLKRYIVDFPSPADAGDIIAPIEDFPEINVISIPSTVGQLQQTANIIKSLNDTGVGTAIVLPDETLCMPLVDSLGDAVDTLNITMGYPMRNSPAADLVSKVISMQLRARKSHEKDTLFRDDILTVLAHPIIRSIGAPDTDHLARALNAGHQYQVPCEWLEQNGNKALVPLWRVAGNNNDLHCVLDYLDRLTAWLLDAIKPAAQQQEVTDNNNIDSEIDGDGDGDGSDGNGDGSEDSAVNAEPFSDTTTTINRGLLTQYRRAIAELRRQYQRYFPKGDTRLTQGTVFRLVERLVGNQAVNFKGEPLHGLQVMGMLETRALDFDNVIIMSMNERIYPRRHFSRSFIPAALRRGYGMATLEHQESISAYYFYRLITRASRVWLLYDSRTSRMGSGEPSRYIRQLQYLYGNPNLHLTTYDYPVSATDHTPMSMRAIPYWRKQLARYTAPDGKRKLSASSINNLISCPVKFTLNYLEGYSDEETPTDYMNDATLGLVVHQVMEDLYMNEMKRTGQSPLYVDKSVIDRLNNSTTIRQLVDKAIKQHHFNDPNRRDNSFPGDIKIMADLFVDIVKQTLRCELDGLHHLEFIAGEKKLEGRLKISPRMAFNFTLSIDRVDRIFPADGSQPTLRIVDYKTGGDELEFKSIDQIFDNSIDKRPKAIVQLMLYCNALAQFDPTVGTDEPIMPIIYKFRDICEKHTISPLKHKYERSKYTVVSDYHLLNEEFLEKLETHLMPYLSQDDDNWKTLTIEPAASNHYCKYCQFTNFCDR